MDKLLVVCHTHRDLKVLRDKEKYLNYRFIFRNDAGLDQPKRFDVFKFLKRLGKVVDHANICGALTSEDYIGAAINSIINEEFGLCGPSVDSVFTSQHKYYSRIAQKRTNKGIVPRFQIINPNEVEQQEIELEFPFFVKPVKSFLSINAKRVNSFEELKKFCRDTKDNTTSFVKPFNDLVRNYTNFEFDCNYLIAEELLTGNQITIEGFVFNKEVTIIAITDSIMYPKTISFKRFDLPSKLSNEIKKRIEKVAKELILGIGFNNGIFNIEMFYDKNKDELKVIEINPRMVSQFSDLVDKVHGISTYDLQILISLGKKPEFVAGKGNYKIASSFIMRKFEDKKVSRIPTNTELLEIQKNYPDSNVEVFAERGKKLSDEINDMGSYRYAMVNLGANSKKELFDNYNEIESKLESKFGFGEPRSFTQKLFKLFEIIKIKSSEL